MSVPIASIEYGFTGMGMSMVLARGGTVVAEHGENLNKLKLSLCFCFPLIS